MWSLCARVFVLITAAVLVIGAKQNPKIDRRSETPVQCSKPALDKLGLRWLGSIPGSKTRGNKVEQSTNLFKAGFDSKKLQWIPFKHMTPATSPTVQPTRPHIPNLGGFGSKYNPRPFLQKYVPGMKTKKPARARSSKSRSGRILLYFFGDDDEADEDEDDEDHLPEETCYSNNCVVYRNKIYDMENEAHVYQLSVDIDRAAELYEEGVVWLQFLGYQREMASEIYDIYDLIIPGFDNEDEDSYLLF